MIKLSRQTAPSELTSKEAQRLTELYRQQGTTVWNKPYIKKALLEMSHRKCCYCEVRLQEEGKYMQVEHFHCKSLYPDEVVAWDNLLPSCNRCNAQKGNHDTFAEPIINPCIDDPKKFLYMEDYRIKSRNNNLLGCRTIEVLYLNDSEHLVYPRFEIGNKIHEAIQTIDELLKDYISGKTTGIQRRNKIINSLKDILKLSSPNKEYSATVSTVIMKDETYLRIRTDLLNASLWDSELEELHSMAQNSALL